MNSINKICVMGRLTKDPELRELEDGTKVTNITLALDRDYKSKEGNKITDFLNFALWNKNAERIVKYSKKGSLVYLEGYVTSKEIETKEYNNLNIMIPIIEVYKHIASKKNVESKDTDTVKDEKVEK